MRTVHSKSPAGGFSLIELVIVIVIIAVIAGIAIPRLSRGSAGANEAALTENLAALRQAIDRYTAEHAAPPALANITGQLTMYTDDAGTSPQTSADSSHVYGPYIRASPALNIGPRPGQTGIAAADGATVGWIYDATSGEIHANVPLSATVQVDETGKLFVDY
jgi:prepilin-type N-terminal cleavage/methylation domain-containing protein